MTHKRKPRAVTILVTSLIVALLVVVLLPSFLSTGGIRKLILSQTNKRISGSLSVDNWSMGWFRGFRFEGIRYEGDAPVTSVEVESVSMDRGLLAAAGGSKDLGTLQVTRPRVTLVVNNAPVGSVSEEGADPGGQDHSQSGLSRTEPRTVSPLQGLPGLKFRFEISDGSAVVRCEGTNAPFDEESIGFGGGLTVDTVAGEITLDGLNVTSTPVVLSCSGGLTDLQGSMDLGAKGELTADLDWFARVASAVTGEKIVMSGRREGPFSLSTSLGGKTVNEIITATVASAGIYIERLEFFGVELGENSVLASMSNGLAAVSIDAPVNGGRVTLSPVMDLAGDTPILTHPENSRVLATVKPTEEMVNQLLARIHPVFKGCVFTAGTLSLDLNKLHLSAGEEQQDSVVRGRVFLDDAVVTAKGMLNDVLELSGIREREVTVGRQDFGFEYRDGRVFPEATTITADGYKFIFSGSIGTDQSLDYAVRIPIVPSMRSIIGRDGYRLLKGETFDIPITGTVTRPRLDTAAFKKMLEGLAKKGVSRLLEREAGKLLEDLFK